MPVVLAVVAWALSGRGLGNCVLGAVLCYVVTYKVAQLAPEPDWLNQRRWAEDWLITGIYAVLVFVWACTVPRITWRRPRND